MATYSVESFLRIFSYDDHQTIVTPLQGQMNTLRESLEKSTRLLLDSNRTAIRATGYQKRRRMINLNVQEMFDSLTKLYADLFQSQWKEFKRVSDAYPLDQPLISGWDKLARVYISHWFRDLYVSIRSAYMKLSAIALSSKCSINRNYESTTYDMFLARLLVDLRPTRIVGALEDAMYIPIICDEPNFSTTNPYNMNDYMISSPCFRGILALMREKHIGWNMISIDNKEATGRPFWLLDWHDQSRVCAWFPMEGNFDLEDVAMAYIVGVACTPKLGAQDLDEWQIIPDDNRGHTLTPLTMNRITPRSFYGSYEIRDIEHGEITIKYSSLTLSTGGGESSSIKRMKVGDTSKAKEPRSSSGTQPMDTEHTFARFRLIDWVYFNRVIFDVDDETRIAAIRKIIIGLDSPATA